MFAVGVMLLNGITFNNYIILLYMCFVSCSVGITVEKGINVIFSSLWCSIDKRRVWDYETVTLTLLLEYVFTLLLFAGIKRLITTERYSLLHSVCDSNERALFHSATLPNFSPYSLLAVCNQPGITQALFESLSYWYAACILDCSAATHHVLFSLLFD